MMRMDGRMSSIQKASSKSIQEKVHAFSSQEGVHFLLCSLNFELMCLTVKRRRRRFEFLHQLMNLFERGLLITH